MEVLTIVFGHAGDDHLGVALGPEGAALQQGLAEVHAARVHVQTSVHVVQGVHHDVQVRPEGIVKDVLGVRRHAILQRAHLERRIDVLRRRCRHSGLCAAHPHRRHHFSMQAKAAGLRYMEVVSRHRRHIQVFTSLRRHLANCPVLHSTWKMGAHTAEVCNINQGLEYYMSQSLLHAISMLGARSAPADIPVAEEELAAKVALLDGVIVGQRDEAGVVGGHAHHGKVLDEFAAQRTRTHKEGAQPLQLLLHCLAKYCNLAIVPAALHETPTRVPLSLVSVPVFQGNTEAVHSLVPK